MPYERFDSRNKYQIVEIRVIHRNACLGHTNKSRNMFIGRTMLSRNSLLCHVNMV